MKPVRAQFVETKVPPRVAWWALAIPALFSATLAWDARRTEAAAAHRRSQTQATLERAESSKQQHMAAKREIVARSPEAAQRRSFDALRAVPWPEVLTALEKTPRAGLTIGSIHIDVPSASATIEATSSDTESTLTFVEHLNAGVGPSDRTLHWGLSEVRRQSQAGTQTVRIRGAWDTRE